MTRQLDLTGQGLVESLKAGEYHTVFVAHDYLLDQGEENLAALLQEEIRIDNARPEMIVFKVLTLHRAICWLLEKCAHEVMQDPTWETLCKRVEAHESRNQQERESEVCL